MTIGSVVLPLLRRHGSSSELKPTHATTATTATSTSTTDRRVSPNLDSTTSIQERPPNPPPPIRQTRRPSPGLAARLKALGFNTDSKQRSPSTEPSGSSDYIGRIPEDHIRSIDSLHRANSTSSLVPRRGRTWSSNSSSRQHAPQITGSAETGFTVLDPAADRRASDATQDLTPPATAATVATPAPPAHAAAALSVSEAAVRADQVARRDPSPVPKVEISDMSTYDDALGDNEDVQKYRLPEHINGNGTKATPATKAAHLERMDDPPPTMPLPKDLPDLPAGEDDFSADVQSYFNPFGLQRAGSIYTLSRVSFANQLAQLTSLQLPDAGSLASKVSAIPTSHAAARALMGAAEQIKSWISKASEVLDGLDADDDVEWAAAGGREGLEDVDNAIVRFEQLISVYVTAIEELQNRTDISSVPASELTMVVTQVETILSEWEKIRRTLTEVKGQVGVAIEWEELWNVVLGDIGYEMDILSTLVFEMEEKRHKSLLAEASEEGVDLKDLETIVEETPPTKVIHTKNRFSVAPAPLPLTPNSPSTPTTAQDDSSLLALFARMQPLRASLDFLPMRLSTFHARAEDTFPTACDELEGRRDGLESSWAALEKDAASLRRELGEDRWVLVFRGAGRQANKMYESVGRSLSKLQEALDNGTQAQNASTLGQKIENYETKKTHYGPAIERVLGIIEKGVQERLTVNGEIVRLHSEMQGKWEDLKSQMAELDKAVEAAQVGRREQQLRDSVSSLMSNDRSSTVGSAADTPGSSPASSVIMSNLNHGTDPTTPGKAGKPRAPTTGLPQPGSRHTPLSGNYPRRNLSAPRSSGYGKPTYTPTPASREASATPTGNRIPRLSFSSASMAGRPRWNSSVKTEDGLTGHNFKPLSAGTPSPYARGATPTGGRNASFAERAHERSGSASKIPLRRSMGGEGESLGSPGPAAEGASPRLPQVTTPLPNRTKNLASFKDRMASPSPGPYAQQPMSSPGGLKAGKRLSVQPSPGAGRSVSRRASMQPLSSEGGERSPSTSPLAVAKRPGSSLAGTAGGNGGRRTSLLPQPRGRETGGRDSRAGGRESPAVMGARVAMRREGSAVGSASGEKDNKPKWRG
ncbi:hypothetical protein VE00_10348 [Pseudogymnoascus sp. WSF 3629]|nr:hypothetical protein VE00_10348 [Pseudogymnoascus sp. WSF 3629]